MTDPLDQLARLAKLAQTQDPLRAHHAARAAVTPLAILDQARAAATPLAILDKARAVFAERGAAYGGVENNFDRAARLAALMLDREISAYDVATILLAVKLARQAHDPSHADSHVDAVNYAAIRAVLSPPRRSA